VTIRFFRLSFYCTLVLGRGQATARLGACSQRRFVSNDADRSRVGRGRHAQRPCVIASSLTDRVRAAAAVVWRLAVEEHAEEIGSRAPGDRMRHLRTRALPPAHQRQGLAGSYI
jgi:hypothetical protein